MQLPKAVIQNQEVNGKTNIDIGSPHEMLQAMVVEGVEQPNSQQQISIRDLKVKFQKFPRILEK